MKKTSLLIVLSLVSLGIVVLRAEPAEQPVASAVAQPSTIPHPMTSSTGPQAGLTQEQMEILKQARAELQNDPEIVELTAQIKALIEKRAKLAEEKLQKINPEAAALVHTMKANQEKMAAARKAQVEAIQAKMKAEQEAAQSAGDKPAAVSATPAPSTAP